MMYHNPAVADVPGTVPPVKIRFIGIRHFIFQEQKFKVGTGGVILGSQQAGSRKRMVGRFGGGAAAPGSFVIEIKNPLCIIGSRGSITAMIGRQKIGLFIVLGIVYQRPRTPV